MKHICCLVLILLCLPAFGNDPAMFRGDAQHTGVYAGAGVPEFHRVKWKFHTPGQVLSSPAVVGDTVYVGSTDHNLYAVDREGGHAEVEI